MKEINEKIERLDSWSKEKQGLSVEWVENQSRERNRYFKQGEIYTCVVGENIGSEIRGHERDGEEIAHVRPVIVISDTRYNRNGLVAVIPLTSTLRVEEDPDVEGRMRPKIKHQYILKKNNYSNLKNDSIVSTGQIKTVSSIRLKKYIGTLTKTDLAGVKNRVKTFFGLEG